MSIICPDCHKPLTSVESCEFCSWQGSNIDLLHILLSTKDMHSTLFNDYQSNYNKIASTDIESSIQSDSYLVTQSKKLFSYLPNVNNLDVLEVGIGKGLLLQQLTDYGIRSCTGIDISPNYLSRLTENERLNLYIANAENIPFHDHFDLVIASDILEHVLNVGNFLISLNRALKQGGHVVIRIPYLEDLTQYSQYRQCPYEFVHLRTFCKRTIASLLSNSGFKCLKFHYDGFNRYQVRHFPSFIRRRIISYLNSKYPTEAEVASFPNYIGNLIMKPKEMTVIAVKHSNI
jgi:SAM-dependent methyltransferase